MYMHFLFYQGDKAIIGTKSKLRLLIGEQLWHL
jgi:hypothetical protein